LKSVDNVGLDWPVFGSYNFALDIMCW